MIWLKKLASILFIGLGIFLWFAPFPLELHGEETKDVLTLKVEAAPLHSRVGPSLLQRSPSPFQLQKVN